MGKQKLLEPVCVTCCHNYTVWPLYRTGFKNWCCSWGCSWPPPKSAAAGAVYSLWVHAHHQGSLSVFFRTLILLFVQLVQFIWTGVNTNSETLALDCDHWNDCVLVYFQLFAVKANDLDTQEHKYAPPGAINAA